mgnify:CR=1 FL=1
MNIKLKIITTLLGVFFGCGIVTSQTPKAEQAMDSKRQHITEVAALTGKGDLDKLKIVLIDGLNDGMAVSELKEVMVHAYAYCGFPRALRGLQTLVAVLDERKAKGIEDDWGRKASPITDTRSKYERGRDILVEISGIPADAPKADYAILAPEIEVFLKEHLFADLFERDVLTYAERELTTVAVIASLGKGVEPMLKGHMGIALNVGITPDELRSVLAIVEKNIGRGEADGGRLALNEVLQSKGLTTAPEAPAVTIGNGVKKQKVTFHNRFLIDMVGDLYFPANYSPAKKYAAIIVGHPFGGVKEQTSGLHARKLAEIGYVTLAFDASYYGESGGYPRRIESPEVRVDDFSAAVDYLTAREDVDPGRIGILGICGWGGMALNAAAVDTRIRATVASTMYDMSRVSANGYFDSMDANGRYELRRQLNAQRLIDAKNGTFETAGGVPDVLPENAPQFVKDYFAYYKTPRGYHARSLNSNRGWNKTSTLSFLNTPLLVYSSEIRSACLLIHGEKAHSRYFSEDAFKKLTGSNKELMIVPGASHVDLYDNFEKIPFDRIEGFFQSALK